MGGIVAAQSKHIVMGDADMSYDFSQHAASPSDVTDPCEPP